MSMLLGWVFDRTMRTPLANFNQDVARPFATQEESLRRILRANADTEFGKRSRFAGIAARDGAELWKWFRRDIPIRSYTDFLPDIERMKQGEKNILVPGLPDMFSLTSGSMSEPKFCPVNRAFIKEHHRQHLLWMYAAYRDHPRINEGKYLIMASPAEMGRTPGGVPYGAMSGKQLEVQSIPVRRRMAAPFQAQSLPNAEDRWFTILLFALAAGDLRVVTSVNPSTLVVLARRLERDAERLLDHLEKGHPAKNDSRADPVLRGLAAAFRPNPGRARALREMWRTDGVLTPAMAWPELEMIFTWQGGSAAFYRPHVAALWGATAQRCLGLRASEGTFSIPLADDAPSGVLGVGGHVMEFVPEEKGEPAADEQTILAGQLETGRLYRMIITTSGGFYRYDLGDLVRVTGFRKRTPTVTFERRAGSVLSATGEKLTENQVVGAMAVASEPGPLLNGFTVTWELVDDVARYVVAMELAGGRDLVLRRRKMLEERVRQLLSVFDYELMNRNHEYQAKREDGRIAPPRAALLADGGYERLRAAAAAEGRPENQFKPPILVAPPGPGRAPVAGCAFFAAMPIELEFS